MGDCERPAVKAKHRVEDLTHWHEGTVNAPLAHRNDHRNACTGAKLARTHRIAGGFDRVSITRACTLFDAGPQWLNADRAANRTVAPNQARS
jgi:hypothetical protein